MKTVRIIPRIDIKGPNVVKGIHLEGLRVLGSPRSFARHYYESGADELLYMDVVASLYGRNSLFDLVSKTAEDIFIPITVGGGIRSIDDISKALNSGADKVCINTAAINDPNLISEAALKFGSSTIVVAIEAIKQPAGEYQAFIDNGREYTGVEVFEWAEKVESLGAGEILITSVDREGTGKGIDIDLVSRITKNSKIPVIAHGGVGKEQDVVDAVKSTEVNAVALSSVLHYKTITDIELEQSSTGEGNHDFVKSGRSFGSIQSSNIGEIKKQLLANGIQVRPLQ